MRILVLGAAGMLGHKLVQVLGEHFEVWAAIRNGFNSVEHFGIFDRARTLTGIDAAEFTSVVSSVEKSRPDVVINAIGIVKQCASSKDVVHMLTVNSIFPHRLADLGREFGYRLISISTDCVFAGTRGNYAEDDAADAFDLYGRSKHFGEVTGENCLTIRTSIIGRELTSNHSLLEWLISKKRQTVDGYVNAVYSGFPTAVFADIIVGLIENHPNLAGLYHISSEPISKFDLLSLVNKKLELRIEIQPSDELKIDRSLNSSRFRDLTGFRPAGWSEMIDKISADTTPYDKWKKQIS